MAKTFLTVKMLSKCEEEPPKPETKEEESPADEPEDDEGQEEVDDDDEELDEQAEAGNKINWFCGIL